MQAGVGVGPESVICSVKHFPGDGPVVDGYDPHNAYGKTAGLPQRPVSSITCCLSARRSTSGAGAVMTDYAIPLGIDTVGAGFSEKLIAGLLRDRPGL